MATHGLESCTVQCGDIKGDGPNLHRALKVVQQPFRVILNLRRDQMEMDLGMITRETKPGSVVSEAYRVVDLPTPSPGHRMPTTPEGRRSDIVLPVGIHLLLVAW
jgi:hypothetical protein